MLITTITQKEIKTIADRFCFTGKWVFRIRTLNSVNKNCNNMRIITVAAKVIYKTIILII